MQTNTRSTSGASSACFPREERLKGRSEIRAVFKKGRCVSGVGQKLFFLRTAGGRRIAFTFPRKFGTAVERNKARRLGRESYRLLRGKMTGAHDLVLLVYPDVARTLSERRAALEALLKKAGLWLER